jgi:hypothetical protein
MTDVVLSHVPSFGALYAQAVASAARLAGARRRGTAPTALPDVAYTARDVPVDPAHVADYQGMLGLRATDRLPAGFVHVLAFPVATALMVRADFPLPLVGLVHVANTVTVRKSLWRDDHLDVRAWATGLRPHRSGTALVVVVEVRRAGTAELAWRGESAYLAKGVHLDGQATSADDDERDSFAPPTPTGAWRLPADTGRRYAAVSGDRNPIHLSALTARPFGFRRAIAHGMYTAARALADVGPAAGHRFVWTARFAAPVYLPSTVAVRVAPDGDGYSYAAWQPDTGKPHLTGDVRPLAA